MSYNYYRDLPGTVYQAVTLAAGYQVQVNFLLEEKRALQLELQKYTTSAGAGEISVQKMKSISVEAAIRRVDQSLYVLDKTNFPQQTINNRVRAVFS